MKARLSVGFQTIGRVAGLASAVAWLLLAAVPAEATRLSEVRVGTHPGFTRVVFELDGPAGYRLQEPRAGGAAELLLELDAESDAKLVPSSRTGLVSNVEVKPSSRGSTIRIGLRNRDVHVTEMILSRPTRIVLDLRPMKETTTWQAPKATSTARKATEPAKTPAAAPTPTAAPKPEPVKTAAAQATTKATESAKAAGGLPDAAPDALEKAAALALRDKPAPAPEPKKAPEPAKPKAPETAKAPEDTKTPEAAKAKAGDEASKPTELAKLGDEPSDDPFLGMELPQAPAPKTAPPLRPDREPGSARTPFQADDPIADAAASGGGIAGFFRSTTGIVAIAITLVVAVLAFLRLRRRGEEEALASSFMEDEEFSLGGETEEAEASAEAEAEAEREPSVMAMPEMPEMPEEPDVQEPHFAAAEEPPSVISEPEPAPTPKEASMPITPLSTPEAPQGPSLDKADLQEFEQRLAQLESRLDEMVQARERLERQVAAQTEELRVQRAAIARTQRVVRSIARPDEGATEPVPRAPDRPGN